MVNKPEDNKLYTTLECTLEYKSVLVNRIDELNSDEVLEKVAENAETTYKIYSVKVGEEEKAKVTNLEEAENLVKELNEKYKKKLNVTAAIEEVITTDKETDVVAIEVAKENISNELTQKVNEINSRRAAEAAAAKRAAAAAEAARQAAEAAASGETVTKVAESGDVQLTVTPVSGIITSRFGSKESIRTRAHSGLDIAAPKGTAIKAAASGTVIFSGYSGGYGNIVKISHGNGIVTYYAHCSALYVSQGQQVNAGDVIAAVGATGNATGNHLHFEVVKDGVSVNPQNYLY